MKRIIFPGSFDPVHNGHLKMAQAAEVALAADEVMFLLSPSTVWKKVDTPYSKRAAMLSLALAHNPKFTFSNIEEKNEGKKNFTYDTLVKLKALYPHDELYLLIGADQANEFHRWLNPHEIIKLATLVVYKRPKNKLSKQNIDAFKMVVIDGAERDTSSSAFRAFKTLDVPVSVLDYVIKEKLYFSREVAKRLSNKRYMHSYEVAKLARMIAGANEQDELKAFKAGLLHDIAKEVPKAKLAELMAKHFKRYQHMDAWTHHQFIGAYFVKHEFFINDKEIYNAVKYHASGAKKMGWLSKVIYAADVIEPTRGYDSSALINACMQNLDEGFKIVLGANKEYLLEEKGVNVNNELTLACFAKYL